MATSSDIRKGLCIHYNNDIYKIVEFLHVKPGKGPAFVRTKLKSVTNGKVVDNTFSAGHKIEEVRVETKRFQYLYKDDSTYHFMNVDDYNQITVDSNLLNFGKLPDVDLLVSSFAGGASGFPKHLTSKAEKILALSKMVFPHKIARLILVEQLYRAKCIINRHPYHKA